MENTRKYLRFESSGYDSFELFNTLLNTIMMNTGNSEQLEIKKDNIVLDFRHNEVFIWISNDNFKRRIDLKLKDQNNILNTKVAYSSPDWFQLEFNECRITYLDLTRDEYDDNFVTEYTGSFWLNIDENQVTFNVNSNCNKLIENYSLMIDFSNDCYLSVNTF